MKRLFYIIFALCSLSALVSCGNQTSKKKEDVHAHDDGSVHKEHDTKQPTKSTTKQESFKVTDADKAGGDIKADTLKSMKSSDSSHNDAHKHESGDDKHDDHDDAHKH